MPEHSLMNSDDSQPVNIRGYLTRTSLAHKLKLISPEEIQRRYVQRVPQLTGHDILRQRKTVVKPTMSIDRGSSIQSTERSTRGTACI